MRTHDSKPAYRDLKLDADGKTIWAACICDKVGAKAAKALVKLDTDGNHDTSWLTQGERERSANRWWTTMEALSRCRGQRLCGRVRCRPEASSAGSKTPRARKSGCDL